MNMLSATIFISMLLLMLGCAQQQPVQNDEQQTITIAYMGPLTGDAASYGIAIQKGIELAKKEMDVPNVELVVEDSKCDAKASVTAITKLITVDNALAVIGEVCSSATLSASPIAENHGVVLISPSSTSPAISDAGDYIFRTIPSDALQGAFGASLVEKDGYENLAILYTNEDYGIGFKTVLEDSFSGEVVASEAMDRSTGDVRTQLTKINNAYPDAIYIISNSPDSAAVALKQIKELGIEAALYGSEGLKSQEVLDAAEEAAEGLVLTTVSAGTSEFITKHVVAYGEQPGPFAAQGYDAFLAVGKAIQDGATTSEGIRDALSTESFNGASGTIDFDEHGDISGNYDIFVVRDGKFEVR